MSGNLLVFGFKPFFVISDVIYCLRVNTLVAAWFQKNAKGTYVNDICELVDQSNVKDVYNRNIFYFCAEVDWFALIIGCLFWPKIILSTCMLNLLPFMWQESAILISLGHNLMVWQCLNRCMNKHTLLVLILESLKMIITICNCRIRNIAFVIKLNHVGYH